jgi:bacillopeptidase F (M6 metalloprotease family)
MARNVDYHNNGILAVFIKVKLLHDKIQHKSESFYFNSFIAWHNKDLLQLNRGTAIVYRTYVGKRTVGDNYTIVPQYK